MSAAPSPELGTCGAAGGRTAAGDPCGRPAGWGRDSDSGPCTDHNTGRPGRVVGEIEGDDPPPPPEHLSEAAADRWRVLNREWVFSPGELLLLEEGLAAWDRVRDCREELREEGYVAVNPDSGNMKRHPLAQELDASLTQMRVSLKQLDLEPPEEG